MGNVVDANVTQVSASQGNRNRKTFYAGGRYWVFYNRVNIYFASSVDGIAWGGITNVGVTVNDRGYAFSVWTDGTYVYYARTVGSHSQQVRFRRGLLNSPAAGQIAWDAEVIVHTGSDSWTPMICLDSSGYPWVYWHDRNDQKAYAKRATNVQGTAWGGIITVIAGIWLCSVGIVPLSNDKIFFFYTNHRDNVPHIVYGKMYDAGLGAQETIYSGLYNYASWSPTSNYVDEIYVALCDSSFNIRFTQRNGVWSAPITLYAKSEFDYATISWNAGTDNLWIFWNEIGTDHVYYIRRCGGVWGSVVDWQNETSDTLPHVLMNSAFENGTNRICAVYLRKAASPYELMFDMVDVCPIAGKPTSSLVPRMKVLDII